MTCIHIGLPKAASKTLQTQLFAKHSQIKYARGGWPFGEGAVDRMLNRFANQAVEPAKVDGMVPVISSEVLVFTNHTRLAMNVENLIGPSKTLLVVRHPLRWIESFYLQLIKNSYLMPLSLIGGGPKGLQGEAKRRFKLEEYLDRCWHQDGKGPLKCLMSKNILEPYVERFGCRNVGVFMFEHLESDPKAFFEAVCSFVGVDPVEGLDRFKEKHVNRRMSGRQLEDVVVNASSGALAEYFRSAPSEEQKRLFGSMIRSVYASSHSDHEAANIEFPDHWKAQIEDLVRDDCNYLHQKWGLPVKEAGYPT